MSQNARFFRYRELKSYIGWTDADAVRIQSISRQVEPSFPSIIDDFYDEIARHPETRRVLTGGQVQIDRLKRTLLKWIHDLFSGRYDAEYVERRWRVGLRHVEIGLDQVYCNMAMSRIRGGLVQALERSWSGDQSELLRAVSSINKIIDLDLAIIEDAYQTEHLAKQQQIERLATIGQVAGGVAHELRNPLNVVKTSIYYLANARNPTPEKITEHLRRIERHIDLADGVITALSNFARMPVPQGRPFPVMECIGEVLDQTMLPESVGVVLEDLSSLPLVLADISQIQIVLRNLIHNAREAMEGKGQLKIRGRVDGTMVEIIVSDTGPGIPPDELARIMEPFFTTKARGLGLGLAISRTIVDKSMGELRVSSEPGKGTTFIVRLPIAQSIEEDNRESPS